MLKIRIPSDDRVDIELSGKIEAIEMAVGLDELIEESQNVSNGRMLYEISDFSLPTLSAIGVEIARLPSLIALLSKFDKCAVLSDSAWLRKAAVIEGALLPGPEIQSFEPHERDAAEAWLALTT
jgi:hypothetical protein